ncbi:MAG: autotransporter domain-containing protein [Candidatus Omnitrophica bacterium]|nr:autotransporter domain-containing protein [Candidatus Omnitrophota bacterium]
MKSKFLYFCLIVILSCLAFPFTILAETYTESINNAIAHAQSPSSTWLPDSSTTGPIIIIPDTSGSSKYGLKYDSSALIVRTASKQGFWTSTSSTTKAPGENYNIVGTISSASGAFVTTGNDMTSFLDSNKGSLTGANVTKLIERGLGMDNDGSHDAIIEYAVADLKNNVIRGTKYLDNSSYNTSTPDNYKDGSSFQSKPTGMDDITYADFKTFFNNFRDKAYIDPKASNHFPFTQFGYTYFWDHNNGATLDDIRGMSEFIILPNQNFSGQALGKPYGTVRVFGIYPTQSYVYTRNDGTSLKTKDEDPTSQYGNGFASFNITGSCDTVWAGHRFQSKIKRNLVDGAANLITNSGTISGGQGILVWSRNYNITNSGTISGVTTSKFGDSTTANIAILFKGNTTIYSASVTPPSDATDINQLTNTGTISSPGTAIQADAGDTQIINNSNGIISGDSYAILTAAGTDTVTINGGELTGSIDLGTGLDTFTFNAGKLNFFLDRDTETSAQIVNAETVSIANNTTLAVAAASGTKNFRNNEQFTVAESANLTVVPANLIIQNDVTLPMITFTATSDTTKLYLTATRNNTYYNQSSGNSSLGATLDSLANSASADMAEIIGALDDTGSATNAQKLEPVAAAPIVNTILETLNNFGNVFSLQMARLNNNDDDLEVYAVNDGKRERVSASTVKNMLAYNSNSILENSFDRPEKWEVFASGFGVMGFQSDHDNSVGYESGGGGTQFGFYRKVNDETMLGMLTGYMFDNVRLNENSGSQDINSVRIGPCGKWLRSNLYATGALTYGYHAVKADRKIVVGSLSRQADADYSMHDISPFLEAGYIFRPSKTLEIVPNISLQYDWMHSQSYNESGAGAANLSVNPADSNSLISVLGIRFNGRFDMKSIIFLPEFNVGWQHEYLGRLGNLKALFSSESAGTFTTNANVFDRNAVRAGVAANFIYGKKHNALSFLYNSEIYDSASNHVFSITCRNYF